ncbi:MAG: hypothetical protein K2W85_02805 [Phycisphaerales bacterium]|nr:hypothetical protein [Phycisphaerales bacterium]
MTTSVEERVVTLERSARRARWIAAGAVGLAVASVLVGQATTATQESVTEAPKDPLNVFIDEQIDAAVTARDADIEAIRKQLQEERFERIKTAIRVAGNDRPLVGSIPADGAAIVISAVGTAVVINGQGVATQVKMPDPLAGSTVMREYNVRLGMLTPDDRWDIDAPAEVIYRARKQHQGQKTK